MPKHKPYYLHASSVFTEEKIEKDHYVLVQNEKIGELTNTPQVGIDIIELGNNRLLPGLLDLHIHGREGADVMDARRQSIETISMSLAKHGVVGFLATTVTSTWENTLAAFTSIGEAYLNQPAGAQVLGAYNEGLFFTKDHKGAHDEKYFLALSLENLDAIIEASNGALKIVALAPELENSNEIIRYLKSKNILTMLGHTNADYAQTCDALDAGACGGVHVFNGMRGIHHREPGCASAVLLNEQSYVEVIADGVHLHPAIINLIYRLKGKNKIGLISDCIVAGGLTDGLYKLGMLDVKVKDGIAKTLSGSLAGSTLTLEVAIKNLVSMTEVDILSAVHMASLAPARLIGLENELGSIAINKRACFTVIDDDFHVLATYIDGKLIYSDKH
jgi:N-acetylgalactosamine-6-phosphate deacetylase